MFEELKPLRRLQDLLPYLVDPKVGLIQWIQENPKEVGCPDFFRFMAQTGNTTAWVSQENFVMGSGAATTREMAVAKAVGEAVERYCPAIYKKSDFPLISYAEANFSCVHPSKFVLFSPQQYKQPKFVFKPLTEQSLIRWAAIQNLRTHKPTHIPALFVYLPYIFYRHEDEIPIAQSMSSGLSCHCSYEEAAIGGICEVIERDCFSMTWQAMVSRPRIRNTTLSRANGDLIQRFEKVGYRVYLVNITNDNGIPTVMSVARHDGKEAVPMVVAASTAPDPEEAVKKSLEELAHTERYVCQIQKERPRLPLMENHDNVRSQVSHVNFWCSPERVVHADFLTNSTAEIDFSDLPNAGSGDPAKDLETLVQRVADTGHDVLVADLTTEDVRELGLWVIRAVIPGYHPLFMGYHNRALGGTRLWEVPQKLGYKGIEPETGDNPFPHPFP